MNIQNISIDKLKKYENNPRRISAQAINAVAESIKEFGFKNPIIIDANNVIIAGHTRFEAAKKLNLKEIPCIIASDLTPEQVKLFRLADNKTAEMTAWDFEKLDFELKELDFNTDIDLSLFGFNIGEDNYDVNNFFTDAEGVSAPKQKAAPTSIIENNENPEEEYNQASGDNKDIPKSEIYTIICPCCNTEIKVNSLFEIIKTGEKDE